jgi:hypothetical protein
MRTQLPFVLIATALACSLTAAPAHARARVFVASYGNDSNPCTFGSPCKTFQQAVTVVDAGGEVTAIDSAGFGPISITKAVTITSPDGVEAGVVPTAGGDAIDISAGSTDAVVLHGLTLNGSGVGLHGIVFNSGGNLTISNCNVHNFTGNGILIAPTSGTLNFVVTNTTVSDNSNVGLYYVPPSGSTITHGVIDRVAAVNNQFGIVIDLTHGTGPAVVAILSSIASNNALNGIATNGGTTPLGVSIDNTSANNNPSHGLIAANTTVLLGRSFFTGNALGVGLVGTTTMYSFQNNQIFLNTGDVSGTLTSVPLK